MSTTVGIHGRTSALVMLETLLATIVIKLVEADCNCWIHILSTGSSDWRQRYQKFLTCADQFDSNLIQVAAIQQSIVHLSRIVPYPP